MRSALIIVGSLALLGWISAAEVEVEDDQFCVVKLCYTGDKSVVRVLDGRQYKKLTARMDAGGDSHTLADGSDERRLVPKWIILRGTFPTREAAEALLTGGKSAGDDAAVKKANAEKLLQMEALKTRHAPAEYDKEATDKSKEELADIRNSMKTDSKIPCKHALGDPLTDTLVDINKPLTNLKPLVTTDIHKLDKVKVERGANQVTVRDDASK